MDSLKNITALWLASVLWPLSLYAEPPVIYTDPIVTHERTIVDIKSCNECHGYFLHHTSVCLCICIVYVKGALHLAKGGDIFFDSLRRLLGNASKS